MPPPVQETFEAIDSPSMQFLPRQQEAPGWRLEEDPLVLRPTSLPTYLDQDAQHFLSYGVVDLTVGKYAPTAGNGFATAEIFRFPDFVKAFGAYSTRKVAGITFLDIQNESFSRAHSIHVWRGPYYIRITGNGTGDALKNLGAFIADKMPPAPGKPAVFSFFPEQLRVPNSERYSAESGFHQSFLANSFQASFDATGQPAEGLIVPAASRAAAAQIMDMYRSAYVHNGKLLDPIPNLGEDNFTAEDRYLGRAVAFRIDRFVIAFSGFGDRQKLTDLAIATDQRIIGTIRKQLVSADKAVENAASKNPASTTTRPPWAP
jgi:hypothetical protein